MKTLFEAMEREAVLRAINNEIAQYQNTGDARFFWRAVLRINKAGEPLPEDFQREIAQFARAMLQAGTAPELARATGMAGSAKKHRGPVQSAAYTRNWRLASEVKTLLQLHPKLTLTAAIAAVARDRGLSVALVKKAYHATFTATKPKRKKAPTALDDAMRAWR